MTALHIKNIHLTIDDTIILNDISASINRGELVGLIGPNGAGKSSLLKCILGLQKQSSGSVWLDGIDLAQSTIKDKAKRMAYAAQGAPVYWPLRADHIVGLGRLPHLNPWGRLTHDDKNIIQKAIHLADCDHLRDRTVTTLSGGERARVMLARVLAADTPWILADEPTASLDPAHQLDVMNILKSQAQAGKGVLVVLHDLSLALRYCNRLILLNRGKLVGEGPSDVILSDQNLSDVFGIKASRWHDNGKDFLVPHHREKGDDI